MVEQKPVNMNEHIKNVCKIGQGNDCCRYLAVGPDGFECLKSSDLKDHIDNRVARNDMTAQGDNCGGRGQETLNKQEKIE
jgi:hypothetical protein